MFRDLYQSRRNFFDSSGGFEGARELRVSLNIEPRVLVSVVAGCQARDLDEDHNRRIVLGFQTITARPDIFLNEDTSKREIRAMVSTFAACVVVLVSLVERRTERLELDFGL